MSHPPRLRVVVGDITGLDVEVIVNAANQFLLAGGGVCGAIHWAAGPRLLLECLTLWGCARGNAKITEGYSLPAKKVIHAVGPVYRGRPEDAEQLAAAYRRSLELCVENGLESVAFPCISTGIYGYPPAEACRLAVATCRAWAAEKPSPQTILFCCFTEAEAAVYRAELEAVG